MEGKKKRCTKCSRGKKGKTYKENGNRKKSEVIDWGGGESDTSGDKRNPTEGSTSLETESARLDGVHINLPVDLRWGQIVSTYLFVSWKEKGES